MAPYQITSPPLKISAAPLTPGNFSPFGTVIQNSPEDQATAIQANQGTAQKIPSISPLTNNYSNAPSQAASSPAMSMFICSPRKLRANATTATTTSYEEAKPTRLFDVKILERHPYTTQTFTPLGLDPSANSDTLYLVIVCPSRPTPISTATVTAVTTAAAAAAATTAPSSPGTDAGSSTAQTWSQEFKVQEQEQEQVALSNPPDLANMKAFLAHGNQAVTYAPGTWHAPMVVLGAKSVEFVVVQFVNGTPEEDCQEVEISPEADGSSDGGDSSDEGVTVVVGSIDDVVNNNNSDNIESDRSASGEELVGEWKAKAKI